MLWSQFTLQSSFFQSSFLLLSQKKRLWGLNCMRINFRWKHKNLLWRILFFKRFTGFRMSSMGRIPSNLMLFLLFIKQIGIRTLFRRLYKLRWSWIILSSKLFKLCFLLWFSNKLGTWILKLNQWNDWWHLWIALFESWVWIHNKSFWRYLYIHSRIHWLEHWTMQLFCK